MYSILVVEGEGSITRLLKETLGIKEYQSIMVLNGEDAIHFALREIPHLIIIDFMLPGTDCYEVVRRLRAHPKSMHIPIVVVNASRSTADEVRAFEFGVDSYVTRPFTSEELMARVRRQLQRMQQSSLSPLTQLPGGLQVERAIDYKLSSLEPWSILYLDLDNFKAFNDVYGFLAGNDMIMLVGRICQRVVYDYGNIDDFVGHIGGDDFVIVTTPERATILYRHILELYKKESVTLYRKEDLERGSISGVDRKGRPYQFPLVSLSIGVVSDQIRCSPSFDEIGTLAAEAKRHAKQSSNNVFHISSQWSKSRQDYPHSLHSSPSFSKASYLGRNLFYFIEEDALAEFK
ncbi:response regulator [Ktedonosporobacter rubrisoli]|uniref:Response regulator n=1 Tax=Ktedonosporobacter rubrisoli TaxID=2509675 RepID=A0A4P6K1Q6_KTERU|nr:response regulator [Ktedonosporobacter rubrisoli]QBD82108.1 response regulator [Ktedonosporobacter rubrisoli]